jgi:hypothetical protein
MDAAGSMMSRIGRADPNPTDEFIMFSISHGLGTGIRGAIGFYLLWIIGRSIWLGGRRLFSQGPATLPPT